MIQRSVTRGILLGVFACCIFPCLPAAAQAPEVLYLPLITHTSAPITHPRPSWGTPLALMPDETALWVVNPDAGSVSLIDTAHLTKTAEIVVGREPWALSPAPDGRRVYVVDRAAGALVVVDTARQVVSATLPLGPEPGMVALSPSGQRAFVTITAANQVTVIDTQHLTVTATISVTALPFALAVSNDGDISDDDEHLYVTHLLAQPRPGGKEATDDGRMGVVTVIDLSTNQVANTITLTHDLHGFPNLLTGITLAGSRAWLPHTRAAPALPNGLTTQVFAAIEVLDLERASAIPPERLSLNDEETFGSPVNNPVVAQPAPDGQRLYVVLAGSDLVEVIDVADPMQPRLMKFLPTGKNPRGLALSADGKQGFVLNYLSRSLTVLDLHNLRIIAEIPVTAETLAPAMLRGKQIFNSASDPRLSKGSWLACASCHPDGATDGVTWIFPDGPRQTPALWNAGQTLPWHWSAALDEAQDVEETIQLIQHGVGLAPGADPAQLGQPNAGRSDDLDALATYLQSGIRSPHVLQPGLPIQAEGRHLFQTVGCVTCHGGPAWTSSTLIAPAGTLDPDGNGMVDAMLHEVGTLNALDIRGADGFDAPALLGVSLTAPYLHDGSQPTLNALLASGHPQSQPGGNGLNAPDITALVAFLQTIDGQTPSVNR